MSDKFKNKYRIESTRLKEWDYGWNGYYFITSCTQGRICFFGDVVDGKMKLNDIGQIANECWMQIPEHFPFVELGDFVIMPNHVHGIIVINKPIEKQNVNHGVETRLIASLPNSVYGLITHDFGGITGNKNPMLHENLAKIIRWYKGKSTFQSRKINPNFAWQPRFYDHIIRSEESLHHISAYINNNPLRWKDDPFFSE